MSSPNLRYFFSTGSRYSYLSMARVPLIEKRFGVTFDWIPVNGKRIRALRGADPFSGNPVSGQYDWGYRERDARAWADYYGIEFIEPVDVEFDVECLLRGVIAAGRQGDVRDYAWKLAKEVFANGAWPLDQSVVDRVADECDLDMERFAEGCADPGVQAELETNCETAVAAGAFGTPTLIVDDEIFWGNDRLVLLEHRLAGMTTDSWAVTGLDHVVLRSQDPERLVEFYQSLLRCEVERSVGDFLWQLRIGDSLLDVMRAQSPKDAANMDHFCLRVRGFDEKALLDELHGRDIEAEATGKIYGAQGFGPSIYLVDPDGNRVELKGVRGA